MRAHRLRSQKPIASKQHSKLHKRRMGTTDILRIKNVETTQLHTKRALGQLHSNILCVHTICTQEKKLQIRVLEQNREQSNLCKSKSLKKDENKAIAYR